MSHQRLENSVQALDLSMVELAKVVEMVILFALVILLDKKMGQGQSAESSLGPSAETIATKL